MNDFIRITTKRFEDKFGGGLGTLAAYPRTNYNDLILFINHALKEAIKQTAERMVVDKKGINKEYSADARRFPQGWNDARNAQLRMMDEIVKEVESERDKV